MNRATKRADKLLGHRLLTNRQPEKGLMENSERADEQSKNES
jgi:hypothetical protein